MSGRPYFAGALCALLTFASWGAPPPDAAGAEAVGEADCNALLRTLNGSSEIAERTRAVEGLGAGKCTEAFERLLELYEVRERGWNILVEPAAEAMVLIDPERAKDIFLGDFEEGDDADAIRDVAPPEDYRSTEEYQDARSAAIAAGNRRGRALYGLSFLEGEEALEAMLPLLEEEEPRMHLLIYEALGRRSFGETRQHVFDLLRSTETCSVDGGLLALEKQLGNGRLPVDKVDTELADLLLQLTEEAEWPGDCLQKFTLGRDTVYLERSVINSNRAAWLFSDLIRTGAYHEARKTLLPEERAEMLLSLMEDERRDTCSRAGAARILLQAGWEGEYERHLDQRNLEQVADHFFFYILRGKEGSETVLAQALQEEGTLEMFHYFTHSGSQALAGAAVKWQREHPLEFRGEDETDEFSCHILWGGATAADPRETVGDPSPGRP